MIVPIVLAASLFPAPAPAAAPSVPRPVTAVLALSECRDCQQSPAVVAGGAPGTFVAQWSVPSTGGVFYRTFDVDGNGGPERQIGQGREARPGGVGAAPDGGFALGWEHPGEIFVQRLGPTGNLIGNPVLVTGDVTGVEDTHTTLTVQPDGRILSVWDRIQTTPDVPVQVVGRQVDASGARSRDIGLWISWGATFPAVCASPGVGAAAAWTQRQGGPGAPPGPAGVSFRTLRALNSAGEIPGEPIEVVPSLEIADNLGVAVACAADGRFAVAWHTRRKPAQAGLDVVVQRLDAAETKVGPPARVNAMAAGNQSSPALLFQNDGRLLVAWASVNRNRAELRGRWLSPQGKPAGSEFVLHKAAGASLASPKLAPVGERGQFVLVWNEAGRNFARVFQP